MKHLNKLSLIIMALLLGFGSLSAAPRMALVEHYTNSGCGPCATNNPAMFDWIKANKTKAIMISYHLNNVDPNDPMYLHNPSLMNERATYYSIPSTPHAIVSGNKGSGASQSAIQSSIDNVTKQTSEITITVNKKPSTGLKQDYSVTVKSTKAYANNMVLRFAIVQAYNRLTPAGPNGEADHWFVARKMLPNSAGTSISLEANKEKSMDFDFNLDAEWYSNMIFVVAWVQNDLTKEVLQVATSALPNWDGVETANPVTAEIKPVGNAYLYVQNNKAFQTKFTVKNSSGQAAKFALSLNNDILPESWSASIDKDMLILASGSSAEVTLDVTTGPNADLGWLNLNAIPIELTTGLSVAGSGISYAMTENSKYGVYIDANNYTGTNSIYTALKTTEQGRNTVYLPFSTPIFDAYNKYFDIVGFSATSLYPNYEHPNFFTKPQIDAMNSTIAAGKHLFVFSDGTGWFAQQNIPEIAEHIQASKSFLTNLGVELNHQQVRYTISGSTISFEKFNANGVALDSVGNNIGLAFNNSNQVMSPFSESFTIKNPGTIKSLFYNIPEDETAAFRLQKGKSKIAYFGFAMESDLNSNMRKNLMQNMVNWMIGKVEYIDPEILTDKSSVNFGEVVIGDSTTQELEIYNLGKADLKINALDFAYNDDKAYSVVDFPAEGLTIVPDASVKITIMFKPVADKNYTTQFLNIKSNDPKRPNEPIQMIGTGKLGEATGPRVKYETTLVDFGDVIQTKEMAFQVTNTGVSDLEFTNVEFIENTDDAFSFVNLSLATVAPNETKEVKVLVQITEEKIYTAKVQLTCNDPLNPVGVVALNANGTPETGDVGEESAFKMLSVTVGPNPMTNYATINYSIEGNTNQNVYMALINSAGQEEALLINGEVAPGTYTMPFDASTLASGAYYIIAKSGNYSAQVPVTVIK